MWSCNEHLCLYFFQDTHDLKIRGLKGFLYLFVVSSGGFQKNLTRLNSHVLVMAASRVCTNKNKVQHFQAYKLTFNSFKKTCVKNKGKMSPTKFYNPLLCRQGL